MADPLTLAITALAGIGGFTVLNSILNTFFGNHGTNATADPMAELLSIMQIQMMIPMLRSVMSAFQPKGPDLGGILLMVAPVIAIVLIVLFLKKFK